MNLKSIIKGCLTQRSNHSYVKCFAFGAITATLFACGIHPASAQSPENLTIDPATGSVKLQTGKTTSDYQLLVGEAISPSDSTGGSFIFDETGKPVFTNNGTIGDDISGRVNDLDMSATGQFVNNGSVAFDGVLTVSDAGLQNTGNISGNIDGGISAGGNIDNRAEGALTGTVSTTADITNAGTMTGITSGDSRSTMSGVNITNNNTISGYGSITAQTYTNAAGTTVSDTGSMNITLSITNNGTIANETIDVANIVTQTLNNTSTGSISDVASLTASTSLINAGTLDNVDAINANASLLNSGVISNGTTISANQGLTNNNTISGFNEISVTGSNEVKNSGTLQNIKKIAGNLSLTAPGRIEMTGDVYDMAITGKLTSVDGTFGVRLAPEDNDTFAVDGDITISGGSVDVSDTAPGTKTYKSGDRWTFITSKGTLSVSDELTVDQDDSIIISPLLKFSTAYDSSNYYLYVERTKAYAPGAQTYNEEQFGQYLDTLGNEFVEGSDLEDVLGSLDSLSPAEGISPAARQAMAQMDGAVYGSMAAMEVQNMTIVNNTLTNYLRPKNMFSCSPSCQSSYPQGMGPCSRMNFWGTYYGVDGNAKSDGNALGGDYSVNGILVGGDNYVSPNMRLGGFFAFGDTQYQVKGLNEQADAESYKAGLYFVHESGNGYLLGNFNYGWADFNMTRNIAFIDRTNTAETSGSEWAFRVEKGFNIPFAQTVFQPFGAFQYLSLNTDGFSETGTGVTALSVDESDYNSYRTEFGGRLLWGFEGPRQTGNLFFQASWMHEYGDTFGTVTSAFNNTNGANYTGNSKYTINGVDLGSDWCNLGIGGSMTQENFTIFGGYDFMVNDQQNLHTGSVGFAYQF